MKREINHPRRRQHTTPSHLFAECVIAKCHSLGMPLFFAHCVFRTATRERTVLSSHSIRNTSVKKLIHARWKHLHYTNQPTNIRMDKWTEIGGETTQHEPLNMSKVDIWCRRRMNELHKLAFKWNIENKSTIRIRCRLGMRKCPVNDNGNQRPAN